MNHFIRKQDGIALITALMMTFISLTIILAVMYMISQNITQTGAFKRYKTALDASYGGTDIVVKELVPQVLKNYASGTLITDIQTSYSALNLTVLATQSCLQDKLTKQTSEWNAACNATTSAKSGADFRLQLQATGGQPYAVYSKIVDTIFGNTDVSGLQLEGAGVAESLAVITPQHIPYVYRLEIQSERASNALEQANISVLYAY